MQILGPDLPSESEIPSVGPNILYFNNPFRDSDTHESLMIIDFAQYHAFMGEETKSQKKKKFRLSISNNLQITK